MRTASLSGAMNNAVENPTIAGAASDKEFEAMFGSERV